MNPRPLTAGLALLLTVAVLAMLAVNSRHTEQLAAVNRQVTESLAESNRQLMLGDRELLLSNAEVMKNLVAQQQQLVEQQRAMVELQNRVTGFSDEQIKARRAQGVRARTLLDLCRTGQVQGKPCENLPDPATLEMLDR